MVDAAHDAVAAQRAPAFALLTDDGVRLSARSWASEFPASALIVLVHGFSASKDNRDVVSLAMRLRDEGFDVVAYDARGHGESEGECTLGDLEHHDVAAAVTWARRRSSRIVLVGASMGAVAVLHHAASGPDVAGVVVVSSPSGWRMPMRARALLTGGLTRTKPGRWVSARRMQVRIHPVWTSPEAPRSLAARVTSPLAIVHGGRDRLIPPSAAADLYAGYAGGEDRRRLWLVADMGHAFDRAGHRAICDAVSWVLERAGEAA